MAITSIENIPMRKGRSALRCEGWADAPRKQPDDIKIALHISADDGRSESPVP